MTFATFAFQSVILLLSSVTCTFNTQFLDNLSQSSSLEIEQKVQLRAQKLSNSLCMLHLFMLLLITGKDEEPISLTKLVSHHQLANLSKALGSNWKKLGSLLGIPEKKLENISTTNKLEHNKGREMLYEWKKTIDGAAMKELQEKLTKMEMGHLLRLFEGTLSYDTERGEE